MFSGASRGGFSSCAAPGLRGAARFGRKLSPPGQRSRAGQKNAPEGADPSGVSFIFWLRIAGLKRGVAECKLLSRFHLPKGRAEIAAIDLINAEVISGVFAVNLRRLSARTFCAGGFPG